MNRKRVRFLLAAVMMAASLLGCNEAVGPGWQTLFFDGFNRSNTTGLRDLGSAEWDIYCVNSDLVTSMLISSNQVESRFHAGDIGIWAAYPKVGGIDYTQRLKSSGKFKVDSSGAVPATIGGLATNIQDSDLACYAVMVKSVALELYEFNGTTIVNFSSDPYTLANNTWYILELESNDLDLFARLKDAASGAVLASTSYTGTGALNPAEPQVGFFNFTTDGGSPFTPVFQPLFFEDFSLSVWR